ncbi:MAG: chromosome segregation ATPase, partial [Dactylosporangium sp.]|nr:hypothetical protein [Dactylosporangium sp.]NNJ60026.1 chromosome segregation ATPase [Dactylosporangium sp.]
MTPSSQPAADIIADRVLVGLQSIRISRLSTHPIPLVAGALVAVAGQGPKDSNGAGKSSLIAQISLLQADEQWRFGSGAQSAVDLLFNAEDAGGEDRWGSADHGYVIGVFTDPVAEDLAVLRRRALTVWLRIDRGNQRGPRLKLRWHDGLHLPTGTSEDERERSADVLWSALAPRAGRQDLPVRDLPRVLYGGHVRCLSFLSTSVRASLTPNLLAQPLNDIPEHRIFAAIAALTGIDHELEQERQARRHEYDHSEQVAAATAGLATWEEDIRAVEAGIDARDATRQLLAEAGDCWRSRTARLLRDAVEREEQIRAELAGLGEAADRCAGQIGELTEQIAQLADDEAFCERLRRAERTVATAADADRALETERALLTRQIEDSERHQRDLVALARDADGRDQASAAAERRDAERAVEVATKGVGIAEQALETAEERLRATDATRTRAQHQHDLLAAAGVPALTWLDAVSARDGARVSLAGIQVPWEDAVVVEPAQLAAARA